MDKHFQRALVLLEQSRHDLAERELRQALAADPDHGMAHAYLALCLAERDELTQATEEARTAIRLAPEWPVAHATLAQVLARRNRHDEAVTAIQEALRLDPADADSFALLAAIRLEQRDWPAALKAAQQGLEHDAEHIGCNNFRAMALTKLGRAEEAGLTIASALARAPEDAYSHANQGWTYLHQRDTSKALEHFREALRLDPTMDYARAGMVEALKARNPIYGLMLRYFLWMNRLSGRAQWAVIIGLYAAYQVLGIVGRNHPEWLPWIRPLLVAYFIFAIMTWIAAPLFNLLLRFNRFGRHALSPDQRWGANLVGALLLPALGFVTWWLLTDYGVAFLGAAYFGFLLLPASAIFNCDRGWPRWGMAIYTLVLASLIPSAFVLFPFDPALAKMGIQGFVLGSILSGFVANALIMITPKR